MADLRISAGLPAPVGRPAADGAKAQALRAAQRAFFDAALAQPTASLAPTPPAGAPVAAVQPAPRAAGATSQDRPTRLLRPGSLVDIRV